MRCLLRRPVSAAVFAWGLKFVTKNTKFWLVTGLSAISQAMRSCHGPDCQRKFCLSVLASFSMIRTHLRIARLAAFSRFVLDLEGLAACFLALEQRVAPLPVREGLGRGRESPISWLCSLQSCVFEVGLLHFLFAVTRCRSGAQFVLKSS